MIKLTFCIVMSSNCFFINVFIYKKCGNIHQVNIIEIIEKARERYQIVSKEKKEEKRQCGHGLYKNLPKDKKQKLAEYKKML